MQAELGKLDEQLTVGRSKSAEAAAQARKSLDDAMQQFQEEVKKAQGLKDVRGLDAYIDSANGLHKATVQYSTDLLQREQSYQDALTDLKRHLEEEMESRREEKWAADPELQRLQQLLELRGARIQRRLGQPASGGEGEGQDVER